MAVEVYKGTNAAIYGNFDQVMFDLAGFFSGSTHFDIIDSYSPHWDSNKDGAPSYTSKRWKGDPIADDDPGQPGHKIWETVNDLGENNAWFIVECQTTIHSGLGLPKWQMKFQCTGNAQYLADPADPTGAKYPKNHGVQRNLFGRFSPWGAWDLADSNPDFAPVGITYPSTENNRIYHGHDGSGNDTRWYLVLDDGGLLTFHRRNQDAYDPMGLGVCCGDVVRVNADHMPMPRAYLGGGSSSFAMDGVAANQLLCEEGLKSNTASNNYKTDDTGGGIAFPDHELNWIQETFTVPTGWMCLGASQPNQHATNLEIDLFPFMPSPVTTKGLWFAMPMLRKGYGIGFVPVHNSQWHSMAHGYTAFLPWNSSTHLFS